MNTTRKSNNLMPQADDHQNKETKAFLNEQEFQKIKNLGIHATESYESYLKKTQCILDFFQESSFQHTLQQSLLVLKALTNEVRLRILVFLMIVQESCFCEIQNLFQLDPSTLSYHLTSLKTANLVQEQRIGKSKKIRLTQNYYSKLPPKFLFELESLIQQLDTNKKF